MVVRLADSIEPALEGGRRHLITVLSQGQPPDREVVASLLPAVQLTADEFGEAARALGPGTPDIDPELRPALFEATTIARVLEAWVERLVRLLGTPCLGRGCPPSSD